MAIIPLNFLSIYHNTTMRIEQIITRRSYDYSFFYDLVYEWEEIFQKELECKFVRDTDLRYKIGGHFPKLSGIVTPWKESFVFEMTPSNGVGHNKKNIVPLIVDFYLKKENLPAFYRMYDNHKIVLVSNLEVMDFLKKNECSLNIGHLALSISDKYEITSETHFEKEYDAALIGRQNPKLKEWLEIYAKKHEDFIYVYGVREKDMFNHYTNKGDFIGNISQRNQFIDLMRKSRVGLYATPGMDGGEKRTNGFNQVTPRFLEFIACGCHILSRYMKNADTDYYEMGKITTCIDSYQQFEEEMDKARANKVDMKLYSEYLSNHYTSIRARQLMQVIKDL